MSPEHLNDQELQLEAYKILVGILANEDSLFWRRNEILIAINGGMLTVIGLMRTSQAAALTESLKLISIAICAVGVAVCVFWYLIAKRSEAFYDHWYEQLKCIEKEHLKKVQIFTLADEFFAKKKVTLGGTEFTLDSASGQIRMFAALQTLAVIFAVIWLVLGIYFLLLT